MIFSATFKLVNRNGCIIFCHHFVSVIGVWDLKPKSQDLFWQNIVLWPV